MGTNFNQALGAGLAAWGAYDAYNNASDQKTAQQIGSQSQQARLGQFLLGSGLANDTASLTGDQVVAPFTADQQKAFDLLRSNVGMGDSDYASAMDTAKNVNATVTDADIARFMNPYTNDVVNTTLDDIGRQRQIASGQIASDAEAAKAFGGDRAVVAQSLSDDSFNRQSAQTAAQLRSQGFNTALAAAQNEATTNAGLKLSGNAQLQQLIDQRRNAATQDATNLLGAGTMQQSNDQAKLDWLKDRVGLSLSPLTAWGRDSSGYDPNVKPADPVSAAISGLNGGQQQASNILNLINSIFGGKSGSSSGSSAGSGGDDLSSWWDSLYGSGDSNSGSTDSGGDLSDWWDAIYGG